LLQEDGYIVHPSDSVEDTLEQFYSKTLDVIIVDIASWPEEGISVYKSLRQSLGTKDISTIIIVPVKLMNSIEFSLAFDDFIIRESENPQEVSLRIKQLLWRHSRLDTENIIRVRDVMLDLNSYEVSIKGKRIYLTYKEYELLKFLVLNRGRVFTREVLLDRVWGYDNYAGTRTVDIHIQRLRTKLGEKSNTYIQTVRNVGYSFIADGEEIVR
ncbi:MAG: response regulator transcription factor, partial [Thermodesulfobacteriota bacterium]|nr:response regulator transcription factor [Thermodesulfobacteriota bacterium]